MSSSNRTERAHRGDSLVSGRSAVRILLLLLGLAMGILAALSAPQWLHAQSQDVDIRLLPASTSTTPGGTTGLTVQIEPNGQEVNGVDICITFSPSLLQVIDADAGTSGVQIQADAGTLGITLLNTVDNTAGVIKYSAGTFGSAPSTTFTLATIGLQAANVNDEATVAFSTSASVCGATPTDAVIGGETVLRDTFGSTVTLGFGAEPPTLTSVSIDSDNGTDEIVRVGDTVTLTFTADETIETLTVAFTVGGVPASGSVTYANTSGNDWTATFVLASGDTEGAVAFTIDFSDTAGNAGTQVSSTTDSSSVTLTNVPSAPGNVSAIPSDVSAVVSWTASASNGGSPITEYAVTSDPGGVTATTSGTSVTVTGLTQYTVYTFIVTAENSAGVSTSSEPSLPVTTTFTDPIIVPATSGWGLAALTLGMLAALAVALPLMPRGQGRRRS